jgi:hypothetical protein
MNHPSMGDVTGLHFTIEDPQIEVLDLDLRNHVDSGWPEEGEQPAILTLIEDCYSSAPSPIYEVTRL